MTRIFGHHQTPDHDTAFAAHLSPVAVTTICCRIDGMYGQGEFRTSKQENKRRDLPSIFLFP